MAFYDDEGDIERAELYRFFANLFIKEPSDETVANAKEIFQLKSIELPQQIRIDFLNLFSGPTANLMPYESFYNYPLGDKPRLWGKAAEEVQAFYLSTGLVLDEATGFIPDHISAELFFMAYLVENGILYFQKVFLAEHLVKWIPLFCDELHKYADTIFYKEIADTLKEFISSEAEEIMGI